MNSMAMHDHPTEASSLRPIPTEPPADAERAEWARSLELAADAWRPELQRLIDALGLRPGHTVLDAGCGPGRITRWLSSRVSPLGHVVGLDADENALEWAAWSLRDLEGCGTTLELWHGDVDALPFEDGSFDAVWCSSVLGYVDDPRAAITELVRMTRPGGRVAILSGDAGRWMHLPISPELEAEMRAAEARASLAGHWGRPIDLHLGRRLFALAASVGPSALEVSTVVWERTAPLSDLDRRYLERALDWTTDPRSEPWLGARFAECRRLFGRGQPGALLDDVDLHVVQLATAVILTV
jgi:SAM-dependent methyltransferase